MANNIVDRDALTPPQKPYVAEEFLRRLTRSILATIEALAQIECLARQPEHTVSSTNASSTLTVDDYVILADATAGNITITLPNVADVNDGKSYIIKKIDSTSNSVTISGDANIDGLASVVITTQYDSYTIITNNTQWFIL